MHGLRRICRRLFLRGTFIAFIGVIMIYIAVGTCHLIFLRDVARKIPPEGARVSHRVK